MRDESPPDIDDGLYHWLHYFDCSDNLDADALMLGFISDGANSCFFSCFEIIFLDDAVQMQLSLSSLLSAAHIEIRKCI